MVFIHGRNIAGINVNRSKMENEQKLNTTWTEMEWFFFGSRKYTSGTDLMEKMIIIIIVLHHCSYTHEGQTMTYWVHFTFFTCPGHNSYSSFFKLSYNFIF